MHVTRKQFLNVCSILRKGKLLVNNLLETYIPVPLLQLRRLLVKVNDDKRKGSSEDD